MIIIPNRQNKQITQVNRGNVLGDLWASFNLDLQSNLGAIRLSPRLRINTRGVLNQGLSVAFKTFDSRIFTIAGSYIFNTASADLNAPFTSNAGTPTTYDPLYSDLAIFNGTLVSTAKEFVYTKPFNGSGSGGYTARGGGISDGSVHKLCYSKRHNRIYYINFNDILSMDTSWTEAAAAGDYFITISAQSGALYTMESDINNIWIGTMNTTPSAQFDSTKDGASIITWDGKSSSITNEYKIKAKGVMALCKDDRNIMYAMDSNGSLLAFNGSGFTEVGRLPLNTKQLTNPQTGIYNGFIHPNGMVFTKNGTFRFLINNLVNDNAASIKDNLASGIWEWSKDTGFVHVSPITYNEVGSLAINDYGQNRISAVGALTEPNLASTALSGKPTTLCGATYYTDASSTTSGIFVDDQIDTIQKYGYFVTSWVQSSNLKEMWSRIYLKYRRFLDAGDKIVCKYRIYDTPSKEFTLTWVNTTSFTTTTNLTDYVGQEVEVIQGTGSGKCSHIVTVSGSGTYTVTVDETYTGVTTGTAKARVQSWKKFLSISNQTSESAKGGIGVSSERIQYKVCIQFTGEDEIYETILINHAQEKLE